MSELRSRRRCPASPPIDSAPTHRSRRGARHARRRTTRGRVPRHRRRVPRSRLAGAARASTRRCARARSSRRPPRRQPRRSARRLHARPRCARCSHAARAALASRRPRGRRRSAPHLIVLAANLPGIALAPLLASLAVRRPALLKSSSREPFFAPAFVAALAAREPALGDAVAALAWRGGDTAIETPLLDAVDRVVAYGGAKALADLRRRAGDKADRVRSQGERRAGGARRSPALRSSASPRRSRATSRCSISVAASRSRRSTPTATPTRSRPRSRARSTRRRDAGRPPSCRPAEAAALRLAREEAAFLGRPSLDPPLERGDRHRRSPRALPALAGTPHRPHSPGSRARPTRSRSCGRTALGFRARPSPATPRAR